MNKKNLMIVYGFYAAGTERYSYELDKILKQKEIDIEILCLTDLPNSNYKNYFYSKHKELGTTIHFFYDIIYRRRTIWEKIQLKTKLKNETDLQKGKLYSFLKQYDDCFFMGQYVYMHFEKFNVDRIFPKINIFVMSLRFQGEGWRKIKKDTPYVFISSPTKEEEIKYEYEGFLNFETIYFPLSFEVTNKYKKWNFNDFKKKRIGVFTRLAADKPIDPFLYAYHILLLNYEDIELHIYGNGDPEKSGANAFLRNIGLEGKVIFRGHQDDMKLSINKDKLDLIWFQGHLNKPGGYAALDTALTGTPQLFWDFYYGDNPSINNFNCVFPHYKNLLKFVEDSLKILTNKEVAINISEKQFKEVFINNDIVKNFCYIERLFFEKK